MEEDEKNKETMPVFKQPRNCLEKCVTLANAFSAAIVACAAIVLAYLTYQYLIETRCQRLAAQHSIKLIEESFDFETSPKPGEFTW